MPAPCVNVGLTERNLVGTGINAGINGTLAQRQSSINSSITDPYFLDRNLIAGVDVFLIQTNYLGTEPYDERRAGFDMRLGYDFNEHLRQVWTYSLVDRDVFNVISHRQPLHSERVRVHGAVADQSGHDPGLPRQQDRSA